MHAAMRLGRIACILLSCLLTVSCARKVQEFSFPMGEGASWTYSGAYSSKLASGSIKLPVSSHTLLVQGAREIDGEKYHQLLVTLEETPYATILLQNDSKGLYLKDGGVKYLLFPRSLSKGATWKARILGKELTFTAGGEKQVTTPAGTYQAMKISFKSESQLSGAFWCAHSTGAVIIDYTDGDERPPRSLHLELREFKKPRNPATGQDSPEPSSK
ncbi:MAG: hypothetical protein RDV48_16785 [Candidatus Eremiobacteraeota bacterium]|nr:hypothetical protein [Candidatus Eremiobacteraeota bacterium]